MCDSADAAGNVPAAEYAPRMTAEGSSLPAIAIEVDSRGGAPSHEVVAYQSPGRSATAVVDKGDVLRPVRLVAAFDQSLIDDGIFAGAHVLRESAHLKKCI